MRWSASSRHRENLACHIHAPTPSTTATSADLGTLPRARVLVSHPTPPLVTILQGKAGLGPDPPADLVAHAGVLRIETLRNRSLGGKSATAGLVEACRHRRRDHSELSGCLVCFKCAKFVEAGAAAQSKGPQCKCLHRRTKHRGGSGECEAEHCGCTQFGALKPEPLTAPSASVARCQVAVSNRTGVGTSASRSHPGCHW